MLEKNGKLIVCEKFKPSASDFNIKIVGVGGGAVHILRRFGSDLLHNPEIIGVDDQDEQFIREREITKFSLERLRRCEARRPADFEAVRHGILVNAFDNAWLFERAELVVFIVCLGGKTGSAIAPVLASIGGLAAELTIVFAVTPAAFEAAERHERAERALRELEKVADTVFHLPMNEARVSGENSNPSEIFARFDEVAASAVRALTKSLYAPDGLYCVDLPDLKLFSRTGKKGYAASGSASGEGRFAQVLKNALGEDNLLIGGAALKDAKSVWIHIEGDENLRLDEVEKIRWQIEDICDDFIQIIFAPVIGKQTMGSIRLTLLATGYD